MQVSKFYTYFLILQSLPARPDRQEVTGQTWFPNTVITNDRGALVGRKGYFNALHSLSISP